MNAVPSIGSRPTHFTAKQEIEFRQHLQHELVRHVGIEPTLFGYAAVFLLAVVVLFCWLISG